VAPIADIADAIAEAKRFSGGCLGPEVPQHRRPAEGRLGSAPPARRAEAPSEDEGDEVRVMVRDILVRQMGLRPGEADQAIREALARQPEIDAPEALFEEIYRARRGSS
jgi:hypothetical protein